MSERVRNVLDCIPTPDDQRPNLLVLIGNRAKAAALRELFGIRRTGRLGKGSSTDIHLHVHSSSIFQHPLLIADGDISDALSELSSNGDVTRRTLRRSNKEFGIGGPLCGIYAQLLSPLANTFCFFCEDVGGLEKVARYLSTWVKYGPPSTEPSRTRPQVIVVTDKIPVGAESEHTARQKVHRLISIETELDVFDHVSAIDVVALLPSGSLSAEARYRPLKERLLSSSDQVRYQKQAAQRLFSATHFAAFLESACEHFSDTSGEPFDFIQSSRSYNPVAPELQEHLSSFLAHIRSLADLMTFAAPFIASTFFIDSYPPDAHCRFLHIY